MTDWPAEIASVDLTGLAHSGYTLRPLTWEDREPIRLWRNEQIEILRQAAPLTAEEQDDYFNDTVRAEMTEARPGQVLVALLLDDSLIGYGGVVHISWPDARGEVSFITETARQEAEQFAADLAAFLELVAALARRLGLRRLTTEAYEFRQDYCAVAERAGFVREGRLRQHAHGETGYVDSLLYGLLLDEVPLGSSL